MKKLLSIFLIILYFSLLNANITIKVGIYDDYPMCYVDKNNKPNGIYVELLNYIAKKENWKIIYVYDTWLNLLEKLKSGEINILTSIAYSSERAKIYDFNEEPIISNWGVVVSNRDINNIAELSGLEIALMEKDIYAEKFIETTKKLLIDDYKIIWCNSYEEILKLIEQGKVNAGVISRFSSIAYSGEYTFVETQIVFGSIELKMAFKKGAEINKAIIPVIDTYIKKLKNDSNSIYWTIYDKYINKMMIPKWVKFTLYYILPILTIFIFFALFTIYILRNTVKKKTSEIEQQNLKLKKLYHKLNDSYERFLTVLSLTSSLLNPEHSNVEYLKEVFELAFKLIPKAKFGSLHFVENHKIKFITTKGHDLKKLNEIEISDREFLLPRKTEIINLNSIYKYDKEKMGEEKFKKFINATKKSKQALWTPIKSGEEVVGVLSLEIPEKSNEEFNELDKKIIESFANYISVHFTLLKYFELQGKFLKNIIIAFSKATELYDIYTKGHSERVAFYSSKIAERLGLEKRRIREVYWASLVHDIGKIFIPLEILNKPSKLTKEEFNLIKQHPIKAYEILKDLEYLENIPEIVKHHHERWDGKGYPDGLKGAEIPIESRIIAVADSFDAMTSDRPYRKALSNKDAIQELISRSGTQFDPEIVKIFIEILKDELKLNTD
ncbi:MAG: transporter substrate-binding domain-containing protein [Thermosipho sp. (in: Bacteria)]|nr:transporter substrate-binding domain-containing protein [Thermosipho sp. (in: thermotogales)]